MYQRVVRFFLVCVFLSISAMLMVACGSSEDASVEFDTKLAGAIETLMQDHIVYSQDPGMTLTVRLANGAMQDFATGVADVAAQKDMTAETAFRVGSNTKPIVAVTVLQLVEEGLIGLDDPLTEYLPEYSEWSNISVRQLLNMRSGLKDFLAVLGFMLDAMGHPETPLTPAEVVEAVRSEPMDFEPGTSGKYTNTSYLLLGMIIEQVTGNTAGDEINARVIQPLGLNNTYLDIGSTQNAALAHGYIDMSVAGPILGLPAGTDMFIPDVIEVEGLIDGTNLLHPTVTWTSGSLVSTAHDMAVFSHALFSGQLLGHDMLEEMKHTQEASLFNGPVQYGLGLQARPTAHGSSIGHGGLNFGYQAATYFFPEHDVVISHLHNFLVDMYDPFQDELMGIILNGPPASYTVYTPPEDLFKDFDTDQYINVKFKGLVNDAAVKPAKTGTMTMRLATEDGSIPYGGLLPSAVLEDGRVTITSVGLTDTKDFHIRLTFISLGPNAANNLDDTGRKAVTMANIDDAFVMVADAQLDEDQNPVRMCYMAITDSTRTGDLVMVESAKPEAGSTMRMFASLPVTEDPDTVAATLSFMGFPACACMGDDGEYHECE